MMFENILLLPTWLDWWESHWGDQTYSRTKPQKVFTYNPYSSFIWRTVLF